MAMAAGVARSCVVLGVAGRAESHFPVPAAVASRPPELIFRIRQGPASAMYRSPALLKAIETGLRNQAARAGVPSGAGLGLAPARLWSIDCAVTSRTSVP